MKKTIAERIAEFREKNVEVDQSHFPHVILTWQAGKNGEKKNIFYDTSKVVCGEKIPLILSYNYTKNQSFKPCYVRKDSNPRFRYEPSKTYFTYSGADLRSSYFKEDKQLKVLEVSCCIFDTSRYHKGDEPRVWVRDENTTMAYFVDGNKIPYDKNGRVLNSFEVFKRIWGSPKKAQYATLKQWGRFLSNCLYSAKNGDTFAHFARNSLVVENGKLLNPYKSWSFMDWMTYSCPIKTCGPKGKKIDALNALVKDNIKDFTKGCKRGNTLNEYTYPEILNDSVMVFRYIGTLNHGVNIEGYRVFVNDKHEVFFSKWNGKEWVISQVQKKATYWYSYYSFYAEKKEVDCLLNKDVIDKFGPFKYIWKTIEANYEPKDYVEKLIKVSNSPILERVLKSNYPYIGKLLDELNPSGNDFKVLSSLFAPLPPLPKGKGFQSVTGLNQYQLAHFNADIEEIFKTAKSYVSYDRIRHIADTIKIVKSISCASNISPLTNKQFDLCYKYAKQIHECYDYKERFAALEAMWDKEERKKFWRRVFSIADKIPTYLEDGYYGEVLKGGMYDTWVIMRDLLKTYEKLPAEDRPIINFSGWKNLIDITREHDNLVALENTLKDKIMMERDRVKAEIMRKVDEKRKEFEYETPNEDFVIKLPQRPSDIFYEGKTLSHCVNGYTDDHVKGLTTIFFLRKKDTPNIPFYTIEVRGIGKKETPLRVVQIHGFGNKWLGNDPDAIPTVMRWLKRSQIYCEDRILLSTAKGYSNCNSPMVEKPII